VWVRRISVPSGRSIRSISTRLGRRDLIQSAALQQLDHDTYFEQWSPPPSLFFGPRGAEWGLLVAVGARAVEIVIASIKLVAWGPRSPERRRPGAQSFFTSMRSSSASRSLARENESWRVRKDGSRFWAHVIIDAIRCCEGHT
jgi:hypothetical protein